MPSLERPFAKAWPLCVAATEHSPHHPPDATGDLTTNNRIAPVPALATILTTIHTPAPPTTTLAAAPVVLQVNSPATTPPVIVTRTHTHVLDATVLPDEVTLTHLGTTAMTTSPTNLLYERTSRLSTGWEGVCSALISLGLPGDDRTQPSPTISFQFRLVLVLRPIRIASLTDCLPSRLLSTILFLCTEPDVSSYSPSRLYLRLSYK